MHFTKVDLLESKYKNGQQSRFSFQPFSLDIPGDEDQLKGMTCRPAAGYSSYYYDSKFKKEKIVLHYTVGHLGSDLRALSKEDYHVSVAFVIARDGTIYQMHSSTHWSYHLGRNALGGNKMQSKKSIGIELSNYGYLVPNGKNLETYYSRKKGNPADVYCSVDDTSQYVRLDPPYRGHHYYAAFTDAQYEQLAKLLRYLTATYNIPRELLPEEERYETTDKVIDFRGIVSHVNFRSDKYDIGPAFDWNRVIQGVQTGKTSSMNSDDELEKAAFEYAEAEKNFQEAQLKVWNNEEDELAKQELAKAEQELVATYQQLEKVKKSMPDDDSEIEERSIDVGFHSEAEIDEAYPHVSGRSIIDYGVDGPKEIEHDPFDFEDEIVLPKIPK